MTGANSLSWFTATPMPTARLRLYCFPFAGGSAASFAQWQAALDPSIELRAVQLPGRGPRTGEAPYTSLPALVDMLGHQLARDTSVPYAFFGHSMGALLAFELARYCARHCLPSPQRLVLSASAAPRLRGVSMRLHEQPDEPFIAALKRYNGTPPAFFEHAELMQLLLPMLRADFGMVADYHYRPDLPLDMPITVLAGSADPHVTRVQALGWERETEADFRLHEFAGDHFFIHSRRDAVLATLNAELTGRPLACSA